MTTIVTRAGKGSPLTHTEVDTNFTNLNTNKLETAAIPLGTLAAPSISFVSDANTGIYSPGADTLAFVTAGSNRVHITSGGLVGIGTSAPGQLLEIKGANARFAVNSTTVADGGILLQGNGTTYAEIKLDASSGILDIAEKQAAGNITFSTGTTPTERLRVTSAGLVGIGTTDMPSDTNLTVLGNFQSGFYRNLTSGNRGYFLNLGAKTSGGFADGARIAGVVESGDSTGYLTFSTRTGGVITEKAQIDSSGRLLVGTSTGKGKLSILQPNTSTIGDGANSGISIVSVGGHAVGRINSIDFMAGFNIDTATASIGYICTDASAYGKGDIFFATRDTTTDVNATERMRITSGSVNGANFLFNCTSLPSASVKGIGIAPNSSFGNYFTCATSSTGNYEHFEFFNPNGLVGSIKTNGSATSYNTSSDYRLKENVAPVTDGIARLQQLKPSRFNFIADPDTTFDGFIAHEAQAIVPECVTGEKDAVDDDGNPKHQGIDQSKLVPLLTAALQEAIAKIESLEARLTAAGI